MCPACEVPWKATVKFADVPTDTAQQSAMEEQIRRAYAIPTIYQHFPVKKENPDPIALKICTTFAKGAPLSPADLDFLNDQGRSLFEPYPSSA